MVSTRPPTTRSGSAHGDGVLGPAPATRITISPGGQRITSPPSVHGVWPVSAAAPSKHYLAARACWPEIRADGGAYGAMFWLMWKRLSGSYFRLT